MEEDIIKGLMSSIKCDTCGQCYEADNIDVLGNYEDLWFMSVFCISCRSQYLVAAIISGEKVTEVITDLTKAELDKFRGRAELTADEVLDMHRFLKHFDGDFARLFSREQA